MTLFETFHRPYRPPVRHTYKYELKFPKPCVDVVTHVVVASNLSAMTRSEIVGYTLVYEVGSNQEAIEQ